MVSWWVSEVDGVSDHKSPTMRTLEDSITGLWMIPDQDPKYENDPVCVLGRRAVEHTPLFVLTRCCWVARGAEKSQNQPAAANHGSGIHDTPDIIVSPECGFLWLRWLLPLLPSPDRRRIGESVTTTPQKGLFWCPTRPSQVPLHRCCNPPLVP